MRLIKIGRSASCNIVLHSDKVSSLHAEMTILNNGDILLEDKNSLNGTYIMNKRIKPGTSVSVVRGDAIRFGDVELMWNQIPMPEDNSSFKALYGIGTNFRNEILVSGNTVSRFHATLKIGKNHRAYIQDHSKNGTTINGNKIPSGQNVKIKKNDAVVCGGVPIDVKRFIPNPILPKLLYGTGIAALLVGVFFVIKALLVPDKPSIRALEAATTCVIGNYYAVVTLEDDPFKELLKSAGWPQEWEFGTLQGTDGSPVLRTLNYVSAQPFSYSGTAFFISSDGYLGTNRHIAIPWEYMGTDSEEIIRQTMAEFRNSMLPVNELRTASQLEELKEAEPLGRILYNYLVSNNSSTRQLNQKIHEVNGWISRFKNSRIIISGRMVGIDIALQGQNLTYTRELIPCYVVADSGDKDKDVALLRMNTPNTPEKIVKNGYYDIKRARLNEKTLIPQEEELITIGYPSGLLLGLHTENNALKPTVSKISVSKEPDENQFQFQGEAIGGQSGSPIVDKNHCLVGVLWGGYRVGSTLGLACNIKHLKELYDKYKKTDE